ncbi:MAG: Fn3-like domain-containing protein [Acidobacteria bacterium]|nr:Fn3-like domain-containing protein [Acidobacteriota bacterium]
MTKRALWIALILCATTSLRAEESALTLSPSVVNLRGAGGASVTHRITLTNRTGVDASFELIAQDVVVKNGTREFHPAGSTPDSIAASATFSKRAVTVLAGESRSVDVTLTLPASTTQRAVVAIFRGTTLFRINGVSATASLGTLFTFTLTGDVRLDCAPLRVEPQTAATNATIEATLENTGSEPLVSTGASVFVDASGAIVGRTQFDSRRFLPGERASLRSEYPGELQPGVYSVVATLQFEGRSLTRTAELVVK